MYMYIMFKISSGGGGGGGGGLGGRISLGPSPSVAVNKEGSSLHSNTFRPRLLGRFNWVQDPTYPTELTITIEVIQCNPSIRTL